MFMRCLHKAISIYLALYLLISLVLSCCVSFGLARWPIISNRAPFLLFDVCFSRAENMNGGIAGTDQHGEYIAYSPAVCQGDFVVSVFMWNPLTNWCDDTTTRWDFIFM